MSSRNVYLDGGQRQTALRLSESLKRAQALVDSGERRAAALIAAVQKHIHEGGGTQIDYVQICHPETLEDVDSVDGTALLALAVRVGKARLIDNCVLQLPA